MLDSFKIHGAITAKLIKADGTVQTVHQGNAIVDVGFDFIADSIGNPTSRPNIMKYIAVGSGTTAVNTSQKALVSQLLCKEAEYEHLTGTKVFKFSTMFIPGEATGAITEAAVFNADGGTMLDRVIFSVINKGLDDSLRVTFTFTMS